MLWDITIKKTKCELFKEMNMNLFHEDSLFLFLLRISWWIKFNRLNAESIVLILFALVSWLFPLSRQ